MIKVYLITKILQTTKDLADADKRRRQQFKEYEMEKKFEEEQKMKGNTGTERNTFRLDYLLTHIIIKLVIS